MYTTIWVGHEPNGYEAKVLREIRDAFEAAGVACQPKLLSLRNWSNSADEQAEPELPEKSVALDVRNQLTVSNAAPRSPIAHWRCLQLSIMEAFIVQLTHYRNRIWVQMQTVER